MLYVTTRNQTDTFTAQRVLTTKRGSDGGLYMPFRIPMFSKDEIQSLGKKTFNRNLADILNLLFGSRLTSYDLDFTIGRHAVRLQQLGQKIIVGECWHNTDWQFSRLVSDLSNIMLTDKNADVEIGGWADTGIRIAVLFGIFGELTREEIASPDRTVDVSLVCGDFSGPMSAWYARAMGLPIGNIVCCCNGNSTMWDFICHGQLRTDCVAVRTMISEADIVIPEGLERLIALYGGPEEVSRYVDALHKGCTYYVDDGLLHRLRQGIYVTVSSEKRIAATIPGAFATHQYVLTSAGALSYSGLQDYRARTGTARTSLIMTEKSPALEAPLISKILGVDEQELRNRL